MIDLARFFCLALVVVAHTMMVSPVLHPDGTVTTENTLGNQRWFEPVVWVLQVMPLFFVVGGHHRSAVLAPAPGPGRQRLRFHAGAAAAAHPPGRRPAGHHVHRALGGAAGRGGPAGHPAAGTSGAGMPLWFLAAYLAAQLNLPLLARLHARAPWLTLAGLASLVVAVDCLRGMMPPLAYLNMVFLWCAVQQLGFFLADGGRWPSGPRRAGGHHLAQQPAAGAARAGWGCTPGTCW